MERAAGAGCWWRKGLCKSLHAGDWLLGQLRGPPPGWVPRPALSQEHPGLALCPQWPHSHLQQPCRLPLPFSRSRLPGLGTGGQATQPRAWQHSVEWVASSSLQSHTHSHKDGIQAQGLLCPLPAPHPTPRRQTPVEEAGDAQSPSTCPSTPCCSYSPSPSLWRVLFPSPRSPAHVLSFVQARMPSSYIFMENSAQGPSCFRVISLSKLPPER